MWLDLPKYRFEILKLWLAIIIIIITYCADLYKSINAQNNK